MTAAPDAAAAELVLSAGVFDILQGDKSTELDVEVRSTGRRLQFLPEALPPVRLIAGALVTSDASLYGFAGFGSDVLEFRDWNVWMSSAAGLYEPNDGLDLGGSIQFRSALELSRRINERSRIGLLFHHLSNARIYGKNPGSESLVITWSTTLGSQRRF